MTQNLNNEPAAPPTDIPIDSANSAESIPSLITTGEPAKAASPAAMLGGFPVSTWIKIAILTGLFGALFWVNLRRLWDKTNPFYGEANWGHATCVPLIGLYYLYVNRERLRNPEPPLVPPGAGRGIWVWIMLMLVLILPLVLVRELANEFFLQGAAGALALGIIALVICLTKGSGKLVGSAWNHSAGWFGGFIMFFGLALFAYAIYPGQNDFLKDFGMVVTLFGMVLCLAGWPVMRIAWFPIAFLVCGIPWPGLLYSRVAGPLQQLAANVAVWTLEMTRVESSASGTKIFIQGHGGVTRTLNVAEACAGLRSLMTFVSVGAAVAFLSARPLWQKITVMLSAIPIAIFCNVMRVSGQGLLDHYVSQQLSESFAHQFVGMIMLIPAFLLILLVGWILDQIFLEEVDRRHVAAAPTIIRRDAAPALVASAAPGRSLAAARAAAGMVVIPRPAVAPALRTVPAPPAGPSNNGPVNRPMTSRPVPPARTPSVTPPPSIRLATRPPRPKPNAAKPPQSPPAPETP